MAHAGPSFILAPAVTLRVALLTVSDAGARGERADRSGDAVILVLRVKGGRLEPALDVLALAVQLRQVNEHGCIRPGSPGGNP